MNALLFSNFLFCFQWYTEVVNNQQFFFFFPVNTDKEKEKENQLHRTMKRKGQLFWSGTERGRGSDVGHEAQRSVQMTTFREVVHLEFLRPVCDPSPRVVPLHGP